MLKMTDITVYTDYKTLVVSVLKSLWFFKTETTLDVRQIKVYIRSGGGNSTGNICYSFYRAGLYSACGE